MTDGPLRSNSVNSSEKDSFNFAYNGRTKFQRGDIVVHFKREISESEGEIGKYDFSYIYRIIAHGEHTETGEKYVVYESLEDGKVYIRPEDMFYGPVDSAKYPNVYQVYRFVKMSK